VVAFVVVLVAGGSSGETPKAVALTTTSVADSTTTTTEPTTTTTVATTTSTTAAPTTTTAKAVVPPPVTTRTVASAPATRNIGMYSGLGTWIDVYDWSATFNRGTERVGPSDIDRMADAGMQTLYVQTSKWDAPSDVLEPENLMPMINRAKARGMTVVAWYLPTFENLQADLNRLVAAARIPGVDALGVDIESTKVQDDAERSRRLVELSNQLRAALPGTALGAIPFPPVVTDVINPNLWSGFPWEALGPLYDVWMPMSYQTMRTQESGWRDAYRYTAENIDRLRAHLRPDVPVHIIGGIADRTTVEDVDGILRAAVERHAVGGSLYDWRTTGAHLYGPLQRFRR
jgi:hypothetical protein